MPGFNAGLVSETFNERTGTPFNFLEMPTDIVFQVVLFRWFLKLSLRDLMYLFLIRGYEFSVPLGDGGNPSPSGEARLRAFNDGRWLETEIKLADGGNSISWWFTLGEFKTRTVMRINENGEWTEVGELVSGDRPLQKMMDLKLRRSSSQK